jgi:Cellulase (glycosyl hydrolase family 5)
MSKRLVMMLCLALLLVCAQAREQWTVAEANAWYEKQPWLVGCNFSPSTAINQLEMWQAESWDPATIDRELGWAEKLGFNSVRVFLHDLLWQQDKEGLLKRMDQFLAMADKHRIGVMFVPLDAVWDPFPKLGRQRAPKPHLHNSGWLQSPGVEILKDPARHDELKAYISGVIARFRDDKRIHAWDIFNEPDNNNRNSYFKHEPTNKLELATALLKKSFAWARDANPSQPITSGVWLGTWADPKKLSPMEKFMVDESDIITFHNYAKLDEVKQCVQNLRRYNRPILCTEYMARPRGSTFDPILGYFKQEKVGAYNWGFVAGKTQTIYPWETWTKTHTNEPAIWFHDIFRPDGKPFDPKEVEYIKSVTGKTDQAVTLAE